MNDSTKKSEQEKMLQAGLITAEDTLLDGVRINHISGPMGMFVEQGWWAYFTNEKLILFLGAGLGFGGFSKKGIVIPYKNIKGIGKCSCRFLPMGVSIDYEVPESGDSCTEKIYFGPGGGKWKSLIAEKAGISLS